MAHDAIEQSRLAQMFPAALPKRELDRVGGGGSAAVTSQHGFALVADRLGHVDALECGVVADALEEGHAEARAGARGGAEHAVCCALGYAVGEGFEALADDDDECAWDGRAVDPFA